MPGKTTNETEFANHIDEIIKKLADDIRKHKDGELQDELAAIIANHLNKAFSTGYSVYTKVGRKKLYKTLSLKFHSDKIKNNFSTNIYNYLVEKNAIDVLQNQLNAFNKKSGSENVVNQTTWLLGENFKPAIITFYQILAFLSGAKPQPRFFSFLRAISLALITLSSVLIVGISRIPSYILYKLYDLFKAITAKIVGEKFKQLVETYQQQNFDKAKERCLKELKQLNPEYNDLEYDDIRQRVMAETKKDTFADLRKSDPEKYAKLNDAEIYTSLEEGGTSQEQIDQAIINGINEQITLSIKIPTWLLAKALISRLIFPEEKLPQILFLWPLRLFLGLPLLLVTIALQLCAKLAEIIPKISALSMATLIITATFVFNIPGYIINTRAFIREYIRSPDYRQELRDDLRPLIQAIIPALIRGILLGGAAAGLTFATFGIAPALLGVAAGTGIAASFMADLEAPEFFSNPYVKATAIGLVLLGVGVSVFFTMGGSAPIIALLLPFALPQAFALQATIAAGIAIGLAFMATVILPGAAKLLTCCLPDGKTAEATASRSEESSETKEANHQGLPQAYPEAPPSTDDWRKPPANEDDYQSLREKANASDKTSGEPSADYAQTTTYGIGGID